MKKSASILIILFNIQLIFCILCQASVSENGKVDSILFKKCMDAVNEINTLTLTKAYLTFDPDNKWILSDNKRPNASDRFLDEFSIYKDAQGNIRKIIYTNYEYGYDVLICYYDTFGELIRAVFNFKDDTESFCGYQFADQGDLFYSNIAYIKYDPDDVEEEILTFEKEIQGPRIEIEYEGQILHFGAYTLERFTHVTNFKSYYNIDSFPSGCATVTFSLDVKSGKTIVGSNNVRIRDAAHLQSNIVETLYAGDDITILAQDKLQNIAPWGEFYWYQVRYQNFFIDDHTGYIFGAFLEPVEKERNP